MLKAKKKKKTTLKRSSELLELRIKYLEDAISDILHNLLWFSVSGTPSEKKKTTMKAKA